MDQKNKTAPKKKEPKIVVAKKPISIKWPGNKFECKKGEKLDWNKLSADIQDKLENHNVV